MKTTPAVPAHHSFKIRLIDVHGNPLRNVPCDVDTDETPPLYDRIRTDESGVLALTVPAKKRLHLTVHLFSDDDPVTMLLEVEAYGGADTVAGARARLNNLGYMAMQDGAPSSAPEDELLGRALDRFRFANGLVDAGGAPAGPMRAPFDEKTKLRLEDVHDNIGSPLMKEP